MLLLAQGWTSVATAEALNRDPHTIGRWASAFGEGGSRVLIFEQTGGSPRSRPDTAGRVEGGGATIAGGVGPGIGQLVLEGGKAGCLGQFWHQPEPQQLLELPASAGIQLQASRETLAQGQLVEAEGLRCGVCRPWGGGPTDRSQGNLCRRGPFPGRRRVAGQVGTQRRTGIGGLDRSQVRGEGQLLLAVCLETGEVEWMDLEGNSNYGTSVAFMKQLRGRHSGRLNVI